MLVRHGADARSALAHVLGVPAEQIEDEGQCCLGAVLTKDGSRGGKAGLFPLARCQAQAGGQ
jgi:hypothetical protein